MAEVLPGLTQVLMSLFLRRQRTLKLLKKRQGLKVACLEGIAYRKGWISEEKMRETAAPMIKNEYGQYLIQVIDEVNRKRAKKRHEA